MWLAAIFSIGVEHWPCHSKVKGSNPATGMDKMEKKYKFFLLKNHLHLKL